MKITKPVMLTRHDEDAVILPEGTVYYTEWYNDDNDYQYIVKNGELVEID